MTIARVGDVELDYEVFGDKGPAVLLVMGLGTRGDSWTPISRALAGAGYRAIQFDNRDVGRSSILAADYTVADMAVDAIGLLDYLKIDRAHLIGISMGGMIAQEILLRAPGRFERAVLIATSPGGRQAKMPPPELLGALLAMGGEGTAGLEGVRELYQAITAPGFADAHPELIEMTVTFALEHPVSREGLMRQIGAIGRFSAWDRLHKVKVPTLIVHGDADPLIPHENGVLLSQRIPGAKLRTLPGVGHLVPLEAPTETFRAIAAFFAS
jgi:pimeloyl-ACP methyl ester carboxylesterase